MCKIINFKPKDDGLKPAMPTKAEIDCLNNAVSLFKNKDLPYWLFSGEKLKEIWDNVIQPIAEDEDLDPWDVAGVFFSWTHGMEFVYENGIPTAVRCGDKEW